ncbi:unnamed protein product [Paramecium octaurelia]|uniref:Phosphomannose isomerase type I catalytic domain-containing protein n=1 Tax=Paramecium octaurelia TaxID=43137 RepID=A0A8S1WXD6_PAROT|nr:unnamed protein product [Paramecium octaurelia]
MQQKIIQRLHGQAQNYAWGMLSSNPDCLVYKLTQKTSNEVRPFAEFWMGSHPSLPSLYENGEKVNLDLPYLFKVLSVDQPLSIQIHPNKEQAKILHATKPNLYPDDNHKPEMAIALTNFEALVGFADQQTIINNIDRNPQIIQKVGENLWNQFLAAQNQQAQDILKQIVAIFLSLTQDDVKQILDNFQWPVKCNPSLDPGSKIEKYDVGYLFLLLMNHLILQPGQAVVLEAGLIHAYLKGNIIETMANSDNVVRCGFTPKQKDVETMKEILICEMKQPNYVEPIVEQSNEYTVKQYLTKYQEFACDCLELKAQEKSKVFKLKQHSILLCLQGLGKLINEEGNYELGFGQTYLINKEIDVHFQVDQHLQLYVCYSQ